MVYQVVPGPPGEVSPADLDGGGPEVQLTLAQRDPDIASKVVMTGSSGRRIAFYANARWLYWYEAPENLTGLRDQILREQPDYFVLETGTGFEREGNDELVRMLTADEQVGAHTRRIDTWPTPDANALCVFSFDWTGN